MAADRIVVGATGEDGEARIAARRLRDAGHEVIFVGGHQTPEHLVRTAVAEDAVRMVIDTDERTLDRLMRLCAELGAADLRVERPV